MAEEQMDRNEGASIWDREPGEIRLQITGAVLLAFLSGFLATELVFRVIFGSV
jgi:hypothetical protein